MCPKFDFHTRTWYKIIIIIITGIARKQDFDTTKLDHFDIGMSWLSYKNIFPAAHKKSGPSSAVEEVTAISL